jgi:hypothetical protein
MLQRGRDSQSAQSPQARHFPAVFWGVLALTAAVRLMGIARPLLGNFATKNCAYAMIARNWAEGRAGLFYPTLDVLKGGSRSLHMLEFPVSTYLTGGLWKMLGGSLDVWGRATAVAFSVGSVALMFLFVRRRHGHDAATAAALAMTLAPVSIIYGQCFMLEASLVFFTLATFYALDRWLRAGDGWPKSGHPARWAGMCGCHTPHRRLLMAGVWLSLLLLTKVYMLVVVLPLGVMVLRSDRRRRVAGVDGHRAEGLVGEPPESRAGGGLRPTARHPAWPGFAAILTLAIWPAACWYAFAYRTASPEGPLAKHVFYSVRQSTEAQLTAYRLLCRPGFYRQILDNLTGVVLTPIGFVLVLAGLLDRQWRQYAAWLLAMVVLVVALARKFHEMNYYYMAVLPPLCIMAGLGWRVIQQRLRPGPKPVALLVAVALLLSFRYAIRPAFITPEEDRGVLDAARLVQRLTAEDEPVVTMHGTTIDLLYYCRRPGWAVAPDTPQLEAVLEDCRRQGARYVAVVGKGPLLQSLVACGEDFRIHRLPAE